MTATPSCPESDELQRFLLGEVSPPELEAIERHLVQCASCLASIPALEAEDALVAALRSQGQREEDFADGQVEAMVRRLEGLCLLAREGSGEATVASSAADQPSAQMAAPGDLAEGPGAGESTAELYGFLAPPQGPGELGRLGGYRVMGVLGAGGMGVVFVAEDPRLGRRVALKVLRPGLASRPVNRQRFLREARAAAAVEHEHIVHVNEVGEDGGVLFVAMPLLQGETLEARLQREGRLPVAEVLRIGREVADGLGAAHAHALIHRDIKPANLFLEQRRGRVKILDFGLARPMAGEVQLTGTGVIVGTPAYMAPEQARGGPIDPRADLFSLGCVLYRMATGRPPFHGATVIEVVAALALERPAAPTQVASEVPAALSELILWLLHKDPAGRPASAQDVMAALADIEREQGSDPSRSAPTGPLLRAGSRTGHRPSRRPSFKLLAGLAALGMIGAMVGLVMLLLPRQGAPVRETDTGMAAPPLRAKLIPTASRPPSLPITLEGVGAPATGVAFSADGRLLLACGREKAKVWDLTSGKKGLALEGGEGWFLSASFSPDGKQLACGTADGRVKIWDGTSGRLLLEKLLPGEVHRLAFSPDGLYLAAPSILYEAGFSFGGLNVFDTHTGGEPTSFFQHSRHRCTSVAYHPDGRQLAVGMGHVEASRKAATGGAIEVWDLAAGRVLRTISGFKHEVGDLSYSPDGKWLAGASEDGTVRTCEVETGKAGLTWKKHQGPATAAAFSPDGSRLASGGEDGMVRVFSPDSGTELLAFRGPGNRITSVAFSPDGTLLACAARDGRVKVWDATRPEPPPPDSRKPARDE